MKIPTIAPKAAGRVQAEVPVIQGDVAGIAPSARFKTILVPLDFSPASTKALEQAVALARKFQGNIHLVHVQAPDEAAAIPGAGHLMRQCAESVTFLQERLAKTQRRHVPSFWPENCHLRSGQPYQAVCQLAREIGADLIVLATRGHTGLKRILLGSTAERIVRFSPCPVLIVRPRKGKKPAHTGKQNGTSTFRKIAVPIDFSTSSMAALHYAAVLAREFGADLLLFHALFPATHVAVDRVSVEMPSGADAAYQKDAELSMEALTQLDFLRGLKCEVLVRWGYAVDEICSLTSQPDIDLLVTSTHGRSGFKHILMGSVAEHVVRYAECPVLVVPALKTLDDEK
jgi:nucleotide-binding universal stress UspA family protein